jgi:hypothetical protein
VSIIVILITIFMLIKNYLIIFENVYD